MKIRLLPPLCLLRLSGAASGAGTGPLGFDL